MKNKETLCSSCYLDAAYWLAFLIIHLTTRMEPIEYDTNMNKLFIPFMVIVCLLLTACDKDDALPGRPMMWSYEILTPDNVKFLDSSTEDPPKYSFKANSKEGNIIMTCENFNALNPISGNSYTYDCGWATLRIEANQVKIHFPPSVSDAPDAYEEIRISANDGKEQLIQPSVYPESLKIMDNQTQNRRLCRKKLSSR